MKMGTKPEFLGAHLSISGGLDKSIERARLVNATSVQIFTKNNKAYFAPKLTDDQIENFLTAKEKAGIRSIVTHAAYLINLCSSNIETQKKSLDSLVQEIIRCNQLEIEYLVLHPGSHTGMGTEAGIEKIAENLSIALEKAGGSTMVLLETAAGQGTNIGSTFEEIRAIYDQCKSTIKSRVGVCLDTCHIFSAGYDISTPEKYHDVFEEFNKIIGLDLLKVIHLNDSKTPCNSRRDRHENLGKGTIDLHVFSEIVNDSRLQNIPIILETPSEDGITEYQEELMLLRGYQK